MFVVGLETVLHFRGPAIDGPFQLYNSLRRIMAGQRAGVDFQFFHGLAMPYLHYPLFRLLGGGFFASEFTRELVSTLLYPATVLLFLKFFLRDWTRTLAWSAAVMAMSIALRLTSLLLAANSLLGVRSTLPTLFPLLLCLRVPRAARLSIAAVTLGIALSVSTEQGLATVAALAVSATIAAILRRSWRTYLAEAGLILAGGALTLVVVLTLLGGVEGMKGALSYNFKLVPMDQYWYFGAPPNIFVPSWASLPTVFAGLWRIPMILLAGVVAVGFACVRLARATDAVDERRQFAFLTVLLYGLISCASLLGTWVNAYVQPLTRVLLLVCAVYLADWLPRHDERLGRRRIAGVSRSEMTATLLAVLCMFVMVTQSLTSTFRSLPHFFRAHVLGGQGPVYDGIWPETIVTGQAILDAHRQEANGRPPLWSTYSGLLEARNGLFNPSFDYVIHALGPTNRRQYVETFNRVKPEIVQTVNPAYTQYEAWIESTSWDFYAALLRQYRLIGNTGWSLVWQRLPTPMPAPVLLWSTTVRPGVDALQLPPVTGTPGEPVLLQVELDYAVDNPLHVLPVVGAMPRYLVGATNAIQKNPVSLNPYEHQTRFPLIAVRGRAAELHWAAFGLLPNASVNVTAVRLYSVPTDPFNHWWFDALVGEQSHTMTQ
jgi:hypothetical protein